MRTSVLLGVFAPSAAVLTWRDDGGREGLDLQRLRGYSFGTFVEEFSRPYKRGSEEWTRRERIFDESLQEVVAFQSGPARSWSKGITRFMDYSKSEYNAMLGYRGRGGRASPSSGLVEFSRSTTTDLPANVMLGKAEGSLVSIVRDQGMCGSCWAEAATSVLEGVMEKNPEVHAAMTQALNGTQKYATLSSQTMVSCTPNPRNCGGKGGCEGATSELGYEMVQKRGMPLAVTWGYVSGSGGTPTCRDDVFATTRVGIAGYTVLPSNKLHPLKQALFETGAPIVVSVDATGWSFYSGGVYSDTTGGQKGEFTVNHAVTLMGYQDKAEGVQGSWLIKNSWGKYWGEAGFIRLEMKDDEESHCGWDYKTHDGLACDGDPDTAWVCGTCGVLYDSSFPTGVHVMEGGQA